MTTRRKTTTSRAVSKRTMPAAPATPRKDMARASHARPAMVRTLSFAEVSTRLATTDKAIRRATHSAAGAMRGSMSEIETAAKTIRASMKQALTAARRASRGIARRLTVAARSMSPVTAPAARTPGLRRRPALKSAR